MENKWSSKPPKRCIEIVEIEIDLDVDSYKMTYLIQPWFSATSLCWTLRLLWIYMNHYIDMYAYIFIYGRKLCSEAMTSPFWDSFLWRHNGIAQRSHRWDRTPSGASWIRSGPLKKKRLRWAGVVVTEASWFYHVCCTSKWEIRENPWKSMNIHEHPWKSMNIHEHPWKSTFCLSLIYGKKHEQRGKTLNGFEILTHPIIQSPSTFISHGVHSTQWRIMRGQTTAMESWEGTIQENSDANDPQSFQIKSWS